MLQLKTFMVKLHLKFTIDGAGAGGGRSWLVCLAGAEIVSGIQTCLNLTNFDQKVTNADLVIVGEGRLVHKV